MPYQGSGRVPASLTDVTNGMLFCDWSQYRLRFGLFDAALQVFAHVRSVDVPPKRRAPRGSRALKLNSTPS